MSGTDWTLTPNLGLYKPIPNADLDTWGGHLNTNADILDTKFGVGGASGPYVPIAGNVTMTGPLTLSGNAAANLQPVSLQQLNSTQASYLPLVGGTLSGPLVLSGDATANLNPVTLQQLNTRVGNYVLKTGDTMSGGLTINLNAAGSLLMLNNTSANAAQLVMQSPAGAYNLIYGYRPAGARWGLALGNFDPESTGNVGSNFVVMRYSDAGVYIDTPFAISRSSGASFFTGSGTMYLNGSAASGWPTLVLAASASGVASQIIGGKGVPAPSGASTLSNRWVMRLGDNGAETGSNVGSDFSLSRYNDAGAIIDTALLIGRSNAAVYMFGGT